VERDRFKTPNGKYSSLCSSCLRIVYNMWLSDDPPPMGCQAGHDAEIWKCPTVYNALVAIVIGLDHSNRKPDERQQWLLDQLGTERAEQMMAHIRSGKEPPTYRMKKPSNERAALQ
jgi:hypothetical protein